MITRIIVILSILALLILGCSDSTGPDAEFKITVTILQNGAIQETYTFTEDDDGESILVFWQGEQIGILEISTFEVYDGSDDDMMETRFLVSARKDDSYSIIASMRDSESLNIDYQIDFVLHPPNTTCGVIYDMSWGIIPNITFEVFQDSVLIDSITTGGHGEFTTDLEPGEYTLVANEFYNVIHLEEGYNDYGIWFSDCVEKPNIYLYPETEILLDVDISFPENGKVIKSIPDFPDQWKGLKITPDGKINNKYDYLFYETEQLALFPAEKGWIVAQNDLEAFFRTNLKETGFIDREIKDFIEFWIPKLVESDHYAIYPQYNEQIDPLIKLEFSKQPDSIIRLLYLIQECNPKHFQLEAPVIPGFSMEGFVVREWGVIRQ